MKADSLAAAPPGPGTARAAPATPEPGARSGVALGLAALAGMLASACCVLPLVFVLVGISGAWIGQLARFEPYSLWLEGLALAALALAAWRIYRPEATAPAACAPENAPCAPARQRLRAWFWAIAVLTGVPIVVPLVAPLFY